jgi:hypothetical protein
LKTIVQKAASNPPLLLFTICFIVLVSTTVPTIYTLDSAELTVGAQSLGIVHAPGYPLYLMVGHVFSWLPVGDVGYRLNLFSTVCLAATAPTLYALINHLIQDRAIAFGTSLVLVWSYYLWTDGIVAEVYAPQVFTLAVCGWWLARMYRYRLSDGRSAAIAGLLYGVAVAAHPSSILFAPGVIVVFLSLRIPWRQCLAAAGIAVGAVLITLVYLPIRYRANPVANMAGWYHPDGTFHRVNLQSAHGLWWLLRGQQFEGMFFVNGIFPSSHQLETFLSRLSGNFLGIGLLLGVIGIAVLASTQRGILVVWLACYVPFSYFYLNYGAPDLETMLGPSYLAWAVVIAYGWQWSTALSSSWIKMGSILLLPAIFLAVNYPMIYAGSTTEVRDRSEMLLDQIPEGAAVFGVWWDIVPLQYLQIVEGQRDDLALYNLFQLDVNKLPLYLEGPMLKPGQPVILVSRLGLRYLDEDQYNFVPLWPDERQDTIGGYKIEKRHEP